MSETVSDNSGPSLSIAHIQTAVGIIDYLCNERAFGGWETIHGVFSLRSELIAFTESANASNTPEGAEAPAEGAEAPALTITHIQNVSRILTFGLDNGHFKGVENVSKALAMHADFAAFIAVAAPEAEQPESDAPAEAPVEG